MNSIHLGCSRRRALQTIGLLGIAAAAPGSIAATEREDAKSQVKDEDIFNFALNLESLETEYYLRGTSGKGMDDADAGSNPGAVTGGNMVPWQDDDLHQFMKEVAANELAHVRFYRKTLE